jgi:hypothetical protein
MDIQELNIPKPSELPTADIVEKLRNLQVPSQEEFVNTLSTIEAVPAMLMLLFGLVSLLLGWKIFKGLVIANATGIGGLLGWYLGDMVKTSNGTMWLFGMVAGGLLMAALAWPMMKYAVSAMGGLAGSFLGYGVWMYVADMTGKTDLVQHAWAGALIGLITMGLLAFIMFRMVVMTFTAFEGALLTVAGALALLLKAEPVAKDVQTALQNNVHMLPLLIILPAVVGFALQYNAVHKMSLRKQKPAEMPKMA